MLHEVLMSHHPRYAESVAVTGDHVVSRRLSRTKLEPSRPSFGPSGMYWEQRENPHDLIDERFQIGISEGPTRGERGLRVNDHSNIILLPKIRKINFRF
jgi:hypothetical protein